MRVFEQTSISGFIGRRHSAAKTCLFMLRAGQNHIYTVYIRCIYGISGRKITKYAVTCGVYIRFWPTLFMLYYLNMPHGLPSAEGGTVRVVVFGMCMCECVCVCTTLFNVHVLPACRLLPHPQTQDQRPVHTIPVPSTPTDPTAICVTDNF
jgi:hypothetical protein